MVIISSNDIKWYHSLKWKLFIIFFILSFVPLLFFLYVMSSTLEDYFEGVNKKELLYQANKIAGTVQKSNYFEDESQRMVTESEILEKSKEGNFRTFIIDGNGFVVSDSNNTEIGKSFLIPEVVVALDGKDDANLRKAEGVIYASAYIENEKSKIIGVVLIISSLDPVYEILAEVNHSWILLTIGISIIIAFLVFFISHIVIVSLDNILKVMEKITDGQLEQRIETKGKDEIARLGQSFNTLTEKLEQNEETRQEFVSNVSHELKTPLSTIKVLSDSMLLQEDMPPEMYNEFLRDINSEIDRMTDIINDLLSLVKLNKRESALNIEETDLDAMVSALVKRLVVLAEQKNISLVYECIKPVIVEADEMKLTLAVSNLVENAIKYTPDGGSVNVSLDCDHQNAFINVQDTGIGISEDEQGKIFNRFYRVDKTRDRETGGTGLGLAITHSTVMLHNGSIKVTSKEGEGAAFLVRIPIKHS